MVTPTFVFSVGILATAILAWGTTQTYLRFSGSGSGTGCAADGCAGPSPSHTSDARTSARPKADGGDRRRGQPSPSTGRAIATPLPRQVQPRAKVQISYRIMQSTAAGFLAQISIADNGGAPDSQWRLSVRLPGARIIWMAGATWHPGSGGDVIIEPAANALKLRAGTTLAVTYAATGQADAPSACLFEGARCHVTH
jgi:hypothetical protein